MKVEAVYGSWGDTEIRDHQDDLPTLRSMIAYGGCFSDVGAELLTQCRDLRELHLVETAITDEGLKQISKIKSLDWLIIDRASITDDGLSALRNLERLDGLHVIATRASDEGFSMLNDLPRLTYLEAIGQSLRTKALSIISMLPSLVSLRLSTHTATDNDFMNLSFCRTLRNVSFDLPLVSFDALEVMKRQLTDCVFEPFRFFNPSEKISFLSGYCIDLYSSKEYNLARAAADRVLQWFPFNAAAHGTLAIINFQMGEYYNFRKCLETARDNASVFGEEDLFDLANHLLSLPSVETVKQVLEEEQPHNLLLRRLRASTAGKEQDDPSYLLDRFEQTLYPPVLQLASSSEITAINYTGPQGGHHPAYLKLFGLRRWGEKREKELAEVPWKW